MQSTVWFTDLSARPGNGLIDKTGTLLRAAGIRERAGRGALTAVKLHFGEKGNTAFIRPIFVRKVVEEIAAAGGKPFLTDANTLYVGTRSNAVDHLNTAIENGFSFASVGAPLIIADGINGKDFVAVNIEGKHIKEAKIGSAVYHADAMIAITHFKGHELTGFGGALKNIGMGLGSRSGKQGMHSDMLPYVEAGNCLGCAKCIKWCPATAITIDKATKTATIDESKCLGCG